MFSVLRNRKNGIFLLFLTLSIVTLPFSIRLNSIAIILLVLCWLLKDGIKEKISNIQPALFWLFLGLYAIHLIGMFYTLNFNHGIFELEKKLTLFIFPLVLGTTSRLLKMEVQRILNYFVVSCVVLSVLCLLYASFRTISSGNFISINTQTDYITYYFFYDGLSGLFIPPVYFSVYIVFSFFIVLKNTVDNWKQRAVSVNSGKVALLFYLTVFLFLLASRTMVIAFFVLTLLYVLYIFFTYGRKWLGISVAVMAALLLMGAVIFTPFLRNRVSEVFTSSYVFKNDPEANRHLAGKMDAVEMRMAKWYFTVQAGKETWLWGVGTGDDEGALLAMYKQNNFMEGYVPRYNSHNQFLQTWLGVGIIGLLILLLNLFVPLYLAFKSKNMLYISFLSLIIFFCLTESLLCRQNGVVFYAFFNSLFAFHALKQS